MGTSELISLQLRMFMIMFAGLFFRKKNIISAEGKKNLTDLVLYLILPCNIIKSFMIEFDGDVLKRFGLVLLVSIMIQVMCGAMTRVLYNRMTPGHKKVLQYGTVVSNAGFLGSPVAEGVFGSIALAMAGIYLIPQRIVMWSAGVSYFTVDESMEDIENMNIEPEAKKETAKKAAKERRKAVVKRVVTHPCIIAVVIGLALMVFQVKLPGFLDAAIKDLSNCNTAVSMLVIGTILADVKLKEMCEKSIFLFSGLRLIVIPLLTYLGCLLFRIDGLVTGVSVLLAAMPAASTTAILAAKYNGDAAYASKVVVTTTVLSLLTTPLWSMLLLANI